MFVRAKVGVSRGSWIWMVSTYVIEFSTLILMVQFVFRENAWGRSYANFNFLGMMFIQKIITLLFMYQIDRGFLHWIPLNMSFILCNYDHLLRLLIGREKGKVQKGSIHNSRFFAFLPKLELRPQAGNWFIL